MVRSIRFILGITFTLLSAQMVQAEEKCLVDQKPIQDLVIDQADILSPNIEQRLRQILLAFEDTTSNQILVVTVNDLCGYDKAEFTYTLGQNWGVGQGGKDNGLVVMVKPHGQQGDRHAFIATGYGLEGAVPDAVAHQIVNEEMIPRFKQGDFEGGVIAAVQTLMSITAGEFTADQYAQGKHRPRSRGVGFIPVFILLIFGLVFYLNVRRVRKYAASNDMAFWAAWALLNASNRRHSGSYGHFSSGSGGFGGGGFGGFGGGGFGGGGAGGSW